MSQVAVLSPEQGLLELMLRNAEQGSRSFDDVFVDGIRRGIPPEVLTRLHELWNATKVVVGEVVAIGRIVVDEIASFLTANPQLATGAALGAAVAFLVSSVPILGPFLAPLATVIAG